ncbi:hypothetical protein ES705_37831 [subsurface metagenome]
MEKQRGAFFRPGRSGGGVGRGRIYPSRPLQTPPLVNLGGLGRNAGGGEAADFRDETGGCQLPFLPIVSVRLRVEGRLRG